MLRIPLNGEDWTARAAGHIPADAPAAARGGAEFPAVVPGCVHDDLIRAGVIGDPNLGDNEERCRWVGWTDWEYRRRFVVDVAATQHEHIELVCEGLDTIVRVRIDGREVGAAANMHHPHRFSLTGIAAGEHELSILFTSPLRHIRAEEARLGPRPVNGDWDPYVFARKAACNFGWDWGPRVPTVGIWRDVYVQAWSIARIESVRPIAQLTSVERNAVPGPDGLIPWRRIGPFDPYPDDESNHLTWFVMGSGAVASTDHRKLIVRGRLSDSNGMAVATFRGVVQHGRFGLGIPAGNAAPWWPREHGDQPLFDLEIYLHQAPIDPDDDPANPATLLDAWRGRIAFRHVRLNTEPDSDGSGSQFTLEINGRPIFCRGANWIPEGLFPSRATADVLRRRVRQAADANLNMLRVWGGGTYESDAFYDACDELGLLVWQDFAFACAAYPQEPPYPQLVEAEARHNITRLARHPSLVLWCGGNECIWAYQGWGFRERLQPGQSWGAHYYHELLPTLLAELDPARPYWPNSPYAGTPDAKTPDPRRGNSHVWDRRDAGYRTIAPRFVSEFGHQSPPNYATLVEALGDPRATPDAPELQASAEIATERVCAPELRRRQRASGGDLARYDAPLREWFAPIRDFDSWHFAAQLLQARAVSLGVEWWRANAPRCAGALFWQWNDCWAGHSWSAIDAAGRRKPLWYALRRACAPRLLTIQPRDGRPTLVAVNDCDEPWELAATIRRMTLLGETRAAGAPRIVVAPTSAQRLDLAGAIGPLSDPAREFFVADEQLTPTASPFVERNPGPARGQRAIWFEAPDRALRYAAPTFEHTTTVHPGRAVAQLTLRAAAVMRDVVLNVDRLDPHAECDEQLVTILPGEEFTFRVSGADPRAALAAELTSAAVAAPPVLRCANELGPQE